MRVCGVSVCARAWLVRCVRAVFLRCLLCVCYIYNINYHIGYRGGVFFNLMPLGLARAGVLGLSGLRECCDPP